MILGEALFAKGSLSVYFQRETEALKQFVEKHMEGRLEVPDDELVEAIVREAVVAPLTIDFDHPEKDVRPVKIRMSDYGRSIEVDGVRASRTYRYSGEQILFQLQPSRYSSMVPYAIVSASKITVGFEGADSADAIKDIIARQESLVREYLDWQRTDIDQHNSGIETKVKGLVASRRKQLDGINRLKDLI